VFVKRLLVMTVLLSAAARPGLPKDKDLKWQEAQLLEISSETIGQGGIHQVGGSVIGPGSGNIWRDKGITYIIQVGDATYTASEFKVAIKSDKVLALMGDDGKPYDLQITKLAHK
jgi:hypothetical protein